MKYYLRTCILAICLFVLSGFFNLIEGNENKINLPQQKVNPGSIYYLPKRIWEKSFSLVLFNKKAKVNYYNKLLDKRLSELSYVVENNVAGELEKATNRFSYYAGVVAETSEDSSDEMKNDIMNRFSQYSKMLESIRDKYPSSTAEWRFVQQNIDTLGILTKKLEN